jgi:WD40 repeat protein/energy-coupling factor transporter ATP-binding protein EcfA2
MHFSLRLRAACCMMENNVYDVFLSYARADWRHAAAIDAALVEEGLRPFFDRRSLAAGLPWVRALEQAIGEAKAVMVLIGPRGLGNTQQYERELAFIRQTREPTFPVVPVILPDTRIDPPFDFLRALTWIDFSQVAKVSDAPDELSRLLAAIHGRQTAADSARMPICPYRGLDAFREEDSAFFFGRGTADDDATPIGQLVRKVREHPFVVIVGRSGSGKSSLVYAGLVPSLRREAIRSWNVLSLRPGPEPLRALAAAFNPRAENEGAAAYAAKISEEADKLRSHEPALLSHMVVQELQQAEGQPDRLLLYIDQWEELYAQAPSGSTERLARNDRDVNLFIDLLLHAARSAPVTVVATVRADFYDPLIGHPEIRSLLPAQQVLLGSMPRSELEHTIVEPAKKVGLAFDPPNLVQRILDEAGEDEGMLPLLQYALKETWALREGRLMSAESYARSGGVQEAIRLTAERTFETLSAEDQQAARQLFLRLVTPGEGKEDTRARAVMPVESAQRKIVEQFAGPRTRLLVTGWDRATRPTVEVAHEALIRRWPRLRGWIDANREKLRSRAAIRQAQTDWEQTGRREDMLLPSGFQLERARALLADSGDITVDDIQEFISLSLTREQTERQQREQALARDEERVAEIKTAQVRTARLQRIARLAIAAVGAVLLVAGGIVGMQQADKARQLAKQDAQNAALKNVLDRRQLELDHARANILADLAGTQLRRSQFVSSLRLAALGTRIDLTLPSSAIATSPAAAELAAGVSQSNWRFVLSGHNAIVFSAHFSPDGSRIVTASGDKTARLWDTGTGEEIMVLRGHEDGLWSAAFSPDGLRIVTASGDKTARIWDTATGKEITVLRGHEGMLSSAAFNPNGSRIVTASEDKTVRIWDTATGKEITVLHGHEGMLSSAVFNPDGSRIVTASEDKTVRIWDAATGKELTVLRGHEGFVSSAAFSPDGSRIVTASEDKTARIWDAATGKELTVLRSHEDIVWSAAFSPDGSRVVTASHDDTTRIWDVPTGKEVAVLRGHGNGVRSAVFSPDGSRIVTASYDKTARIWDAPTGAEITLLRGHEATVSSAAFNLDNSRIVTASYDKTARIWDAATGKEVTVLRGHEATVWSAAFSPDGSRIVTASEDKTARIWNTATGKEVTVLRGHEGSVSSAAFSPDGSRIVTASADKTARIWDAATSKNITMLRGHEGVVWSAAFSPDGSRIVTASYDETARIWDTANGKEITVLRGHEDMMSSAAFSPDGSRIVTGSFDKTARIWDTTNGKEITVLRGHEGNLPSVAFSPDGSRIVTASIDKTVRIWDVPTGKEVTVLHGNDEYLSAAFSPDGSRIVTASGDKTARIWDAHLLTMRTKDVLHEACARLAGITKLTREEMRLAGYPDSLPSIDVCIE